MEATLQNLKVLFLEDSEIDIEIMYQKLIDNFKCPITMDKAQNEECFLHLIKNNQYDVILADYTLPGYNAVSALEQSLEICPATPFICVSGTIGEDLAVEMLKQGATDYVLKDRLQRLPFAIRRAIKNTLLEQERKKAEQAIKELNQNNQLILDSTIDGIAMMDRDGNISNINEKFARRLGKTVEDVIGTNFKTFLPEEIFGDMYQQRLERLRKAFDSGQPEMFEDSRNGIHFYNRFYPIFKDGNVIAVTLFSTDITDRVKMEEETRRNASLKIEADIHRKKEEEYLEILNGSTEASWIYDFSNKTLEFSREWLMRIGGETIPVKDMDAYVRSLVHPDDVTRMIKERMQIIERKLPKYKVEYRLKTLEGYKWVFDQSKIIYNENGTPEKIYGTSMDITERKQTEEKLRESEERFRAVHENALDRFTILKPFYNGGGEIVDFTYVYQNSQAAKTTGRRPEELVGRRMTEIFPTFPQTRFFERYKQVVETGQALEFEDLYGFDGLNEWFRVTVTPLHDGIAVATQIITESKRLADEIKRSELLLHTIVQNTTDLLYLNDSEGRVVFVNDAYIKSFGIEPKDVVGKNALELYHDEKVARIIEENDRKVMQTGEAIVAEELAQTADGILSTFLVTKSPWRDGDGNIVGVVGVAHNITERQQAEETLKISEANFRAVFEHSQIGIVIGDSAGHVTNSNPAIERMLSYSKDELRGMTYSEFTHPEDLNIEMSLAQELIDGKRDYYKIEKRYIRKDKQIIWVRLIVAVMVGSDGEKLGLGMIEDITERKQAEEALGEAYGQIQDLINNSPDIVYAFDLEERFVMANTALAQLFNTTPEQLMGKRRHEFMPKVDADWHEANDRKAIKENKALEFEEFSMLNNRSITWLTKKFPLHDIQGRIYAVAGISVDISIRKQVEDALRKSEEKALVLVEELAKADKNKNQFISVLSHELRNPLAVIVASLSLLEITDRQEQISRSKDIIKRQVGQLTKLVDDLLELTRINQNRITLKKELINLNDIVINAAQDHQSEYKAKGIRLLTELPQEPIILNADPGRIAQCVGNLLQNAIKFTPEAGAVDLSLETENGEAVICVRDNGIGISPNLLGHLFKPFTQADDSLDRQNGGGLGLGLSITKGLAELHNGHVVAYSEGLGKGSLFMIRLPITAQAAAAPMPSDVKKTGRTYKILLIEDNENLAEVLCNIFGVMGHQACAANNGMEGITQAKKIRPDVILCDIGLPGLSGYEVAKILKTDQELKSTFLIALTGYTADAVIEMAKESGFDRYLAKPVDMALLEKILSEIP